MSEVSANMQVACKVEAEPLLDCTPLPDANPMASLDNTQCEAGWSKQRFCGNVYCYKEVKISTNYQDFDHSVTHDWCKLSYPHNGARLASVHCVEEHYYIQSLTAESIIGLHVPENLQNNITFDISSFTWTDGSPVDFVGWNRFSKQRVSTENKQEPLFPASPVFGKQKPSYVAYNRRDDGSSGWTNIDYGYHRAICKTKATPKP
uniref:C-type lectin domain-containing protein n=1 Tax=Panagrellus redivivus TaxID=6233 RepID=A0A7E4VK16_PANRE